MSKRTEAAFAIVAALAYACVDSSPCDPGQKLEFNACYTVTQPLDGSTDIDAGNVTDAGAMVDAETDAGAKDPGPSDNFGATCSMPSDCVGASPYCAISPGNTEGYCSQVDCVKQPKVCPPDWTCFDLTGLGAEISSFCRRPR